MCKLSIIVPVYNVEKYLRQCLESLRKQTFQGIEVIMVDDGSPDNCGTICDEYAKKDPRFIVIHKPNGGLSTAWNCGLEHVTGDYLTFVDSDDWVDVDYYERIFQQMNSDHPDVFLTNGHVVETPDGRHHEVHLFGKPFTAKEDDEKSELLAHTLAAIHAPNGELYRDLGMVWGKLYRSGFIKGNDLHFTTSVVTKCAWIDALFVFQTIGKASAIQGGTVIGYHYRIVDYSATQKYNPNLLTAYEAFFDELNTYIVERDGAVRNHRLCQAIHQRTLYGISDCIRRSWFHPQNQNDKENLKEEISRVKHVPCFQEAIYSQDNKYILKKYLLLKYMCRLPGIWPLKLLGKLNRVKKRLRQTY